MKKTINSKILKTISVATVGFLGLYMYFVTSTILHIVTRQHNLEEIRTLGSQLSDLESNYMDLQGKINLQVASELGFHSKTSNFIRANQIVGSLSRNEI